MVSVVFCFLFLYFYFGFVLDKSKKRESFDKYSAEEKVVEETSEEEDFNKSVTERRQQIEKRLSIDRAIPASSQRVEIVQEISSIKQQSLVEDKILEVEQKGTFEPPDSKATSKTAEKTTLPSAGSRDVEKETSEVKTTVTTVVKETRTETKEEETLHKTIEVSKERRDSELLEGVTHILESKKPISKLIASEGKLD